jgi:hypothetical protein
MEAMLMFNKAVEASSITLSMLQLTGAYIFPPLQVEVWGGTDKNNLRLLGKTDPPQPGKESGNENLAIKCSFNKTKVTCIKLVVTPVKSLPSWLPRRSTRESSKSLAFYR